MFPLYAKGSLTLIKSLARIFKALYAEGPRNLWFKILQELMVYRRLTLIEIPDGYAVLSHSHTLVTKVSLLHKEDLEAYERFRPDTGLSELHRRLRDGQQCFIAWRTERIVSAIWATRSYAWIPYLNLGIKLESDDAYIHDSYTVPDLRGRELDAIRSMLMRRTLREQGVKRIIGAILPENRAVQKLLEKRGHRPIGIVGYRKLGPWRKDFLRWYDPLPARVG
jgi:hypothetical protein